MTWVMPKSRSSTADRPVVGGPAVGAQDHERGQPRRRAASRRLRGATASAPGAASRCRRRSVWRTGPRPSRGPARSGRAGWRPRARAGRAVSVSSIRSSSAALRAREQVVDERGQRAAQVQRPGGAGGEADVDGHGVRERAAVGCRSRTRRASTRRGSSPRRPDSGRASTQRPRRSAPSPGRAPRRSRLRCGGPGRSGRSRRESRRGRGG